MASRKHWNYGTKDDEEFDRVNTVIGETFAHSAEMNQYGRRRAGLRFAFFE